MVDALVVDTIENLEGRAKRVNKRV